MSTSKIKRIGILAPKAYRHILGLSNIRQSFGRSFPAADIFCLEEADIRSMNRLETCDLVVLPPSFYGEDTPYKHYLHGRAADNLNAYAQFGRIAAFCSGTYAILKQFRYTFANGLTEIYHGYVPVIECEAQGPYQDGRNADTLRIVPIFSKMSAPSETINLCYDGGPLIDPKSFKKTDDVLPLAYFPGGEISALAQRVGLKGIVVAFSSLADIQAQDVPQGGEYENIRQSLMETQLAHQQLWSQSMNILESRSLEIL